MKKWLVTAGAICALGVAALAGAQEINFGIIATDTASTQRERWEPFFRDMEKKTGLKIKSFYAPDYAGVIEAQRFNKVQVAWYGNKAAMEAVDRANSEVFAQIVYSGGSLGYYSLLIVHKDSPMNKIDPKTHFKVVRNASHGANLQAVLNKQIDVATNNTEEMEKLEMTKPELLKQLRIIWKSPLIPSDPLVWRKDLDPAVKAKIKDFVLNYGKTDANEKTVLKNIYNYSGFRESSNAQLIPIRQLEYYKDRVKIEGDANMAADEKQKKIAEIDLKLLELDRQARR